MKRPVENQYSSHVAYARDLELYADSVEKQLAEREAQIAVLRDALVKCRAHIGDPANFDCYGTDRELAEFLQQVKRDEDSAIEVADAALATPPQDSYLMQYLGEPVAWIGVSGHLVHDIKSLMPSLRHSAKPLYALPRKELK